MAGEKTDDVITYTEEQMDEHARRQKEAADRTLKANPEAGEATESEAEPTTETEPTSEPDETETPRRRRR